MAFTRAQLRGKLYNLGIGLGKQRTADAVATNGVEDALEFTGKTEGHYKGQTIYIPTAASSDDVERIADIITSSIRLTHLGVAYAGSGILDYELIGLGLSSTDLNDIIQRMLRIVYYEDFWPVDWGEDNDFASSLTTTPHDWTSGAVNMTTIAKVATTGVPGQSGKRNLRLTGNGTGNGYVIDRRLSVEPGDRLHHGGVARCNDTGTLSYALYDVTNSAVISTVTFSSRAFQIIERDDTVPSGCTQVERHIGNVTASGITEWDHLFGHHLDAWQFNVPSFISEKYRFLGFGPARYHGRSTGTDRSNADGRQFLTWAKGGSLDYELYPLHEAAEPQFLQIGRRGGLKGEEYWIHCKRQRSDIETLDNETDTSNIQEDEAMEALQFLLYDTLHSKHHDATGASEWEERREYWKNKVDFRRFSKPLIQPTPADRGAVFLGMRGRGGW